MSIRKIFFLFTIVLCTACSSDLFIEHNGNMPEQSRVDQLRLGQSKQQVLDILGGPSAKTGLSDDHWIYMSSTVRRVAFLRPTELDREILAITFDDNKVSKIETRTLEDGNNISIDTDETSAADRDDGFFKKYFGGVGTYMPFGSGDKGL